MEKWEWAWLAGLFEGEGTIAFTGRSNVQIRIGMADRDVIDTVFRLAPGRTVLRLEKKNRIKPLYLWQLSSRDEVRWFLEGVYPFLHSRRRARVDEAYERLTRNRGAKHLRTHCPRGHPLSGDNLYVARTTGGRSCLTCRRARDRARIRVR